MFGASNQQAGGGLFGNPTTRPQTGGGLFGGMGSQTQQSGSGLFGSLGQNNQQNPQTQPQASNLFGGLNNQSQQPTGSSLLGGQINQPNQQQQSGGLFGQTMQQNQPPQTSGLFGGLGQSTQQTQPQQNVGLFGQSNQQQAGGFLNTQQQGLAQSQQNQLSNPLWQPNSSLSTREKNIPDQIKTVLEQWDTGNSNCAFQYYFYNKVPPHTAEFFKPSPYEDPKKWDEALSKKPGPGYVPVLCTGFRQLGERLNVQAQNLAIFNSQLHQVNKALTELLLNHDTNISIRAMDARRKHSILKQRCLTLATKVQVLRNRGYAMGGDEEDLKTKLVALDKGVSDPGLDARQEEIWARMVTVQERARLLRTEIEKNGAPTEQVLDEETVKRAQKILEDYQTQLVHLKKELDSIQKDYVEWEKSQAPKASGR